VVYNKLSHTRNVRNINKQLTTARNKQIEWKPSRVRQTHILSLFTKGMDDILGYGRLQHGTDFPFNTLQVILMMIFPTNHLTGPKKGPNQIEQQQSYSVHKAKMYSHLTWQRCSIHVRRSSVLTTLLPATVLYAFRHCNQHRKKLSAEYIDINIKHPFTVQQALW